MKRFRLQGACALVAAGLAAACTEQPFQLGYQPDLSPPTVSIVVPANDTINVQSGFSFTVDATDNLGLKTITVTLSAGLTPHDTTFTTAVTNIGWTVTVPPTETATLGGPVLITATAVDGNGNAATDTVTVIATNPKALIVTLVRPTTGAITAPGKQIPVEVRASQQDGLQYVGWETTGGVVTARDSLVDPTLPDTLVMQDTLDIPATTPAGTFGIRGFAVDASGRLVRTSIVLVTVQLVVTDTIGPLVTFTVAQRAEVKDSIFVRARDPSGISSIGWIALDLAGNTLSSATTALGGTLTDVTQAYDLNLSLTGAQLPAKVIIKAFATDAAGNTDSARVDTLNFASATLADTITVVNGITEPLPAGGRVADAIYNPNRDEVYLTNIDKNWLEVFSVADTSFKNPILVYGSRPWGIALWPKDRTGANYDTVIVANSGETDLSVVNVVTGVVTKVPLPLFDVQTVHTETDPKNGSPQKVYKQYFFSDRPEYVGAVCAAATCKPGGTGDVVAVYSTTPTPGQSTPFPERGSVRWENLTTPGSSHFFWEHAVSGFTLSTDTLQINRRDPVTGAVTPLLDADCGVIVPPTELAFLDTTFVRNSGNFTRTIIGEGGSSGAPILGYSRALTYDVTSGQTATCTVGLGTFPLNFDAGVSPALNVRSFIANTATPVRAVGINFNGFTNLIRADSVYVLNAGLRLMGLMEIGGPNWGMDLNFNHDYDATDGQSKSGLTHTPTANADRLAFVASPDPEIDVFDTFAKTKIGTVPIKQPVIGPLRVAKLATGEQLLVGVTAGGVVVVRLPAVANPYTQSAGWSGGRQ